MKEKTMYNFDEIIDRTHTNSLNTDGFRGYIFHADETMTFPYKDEEFIRMWVADMEFATPEVIIDAIRERLDRKIFGYTNIFEKSYYDAFASWCKTRYGFTFPREELVTSNGVVPALYELVEYICEPGENVLYLAPSYSYFKKSADYNNRGSIACDLIYKNGDYYIDFEDFEKKASESKLFILCNPHNPCGRIWTNEELTKIAEIMQKHDVWVISDEIHCDLLRTGLTHTPLGKIMPDYDKLITAMAPSKTFNIAGLMISNLLIRNEEMRNKWLQRPYNADNPLSVVAAQAAYEKGADWLEALQKYLDENFEFTAEYLGKNLPKAKYKVAGATYLAWVDLNEYFEPDEDLTMFFAYKAGVLLEASKMFVQNGDGFIRLNLACPKSMLEEGLKRICDAIKKHKSFTR